MPNPIARAGSDLFSTMWTAIAGAIRATASARRLDDDQGGDAHTARASGLYGEFFQYLITAEKSPLTPALKKLELKEDR